MPMYRKKPLMVEAYILEQSNAEKLAKWVGGRTISEVRGEFMGLLIPTLEGVMKADMGDYVIKGIKGEFYPCKPDIFELSYEQVGLRDGSQLANG